LLARSFIALGRAELGFELSATYAFNVARASAPAASAGTASADADFAAELAGRLAALPSVAAAGAAESLPLEGTGRRSDYQATGTTGSAPLRIVTPGYHAALGIPLRAGRALDETDVAGAADVIVVNESFARRHWSDAGAVGGTITLGERTFEIVGIVGDTREWGPHVEGPPIMYAAAAQVPGAGPLSIVLRTTPGGEGTAGLHALIRTTVAQMDPDAAAHDIASMNTRLRRNTARSELLMTVMAIFAGVALFLAVGGVHATVANATRHRVPELAIRRTLGATSAEIARLILRHAAGIVLGGIAVGLPLSFATAAVLARFLAGTGPVDPIAFATAGLLLAAGAALAAAVPTVRACRVSPLNALRDGTGPTAG
jgi:putative ABC transport system permease protein